MSFNRELIERIKLYSLTRNGEEITDEKAEEYLNALADFYEAYSGLVQNKNEDSQILLDSRRKIVSD